jgi:hypothetical protein
MSRQRASGFALILGSLGGLITMALHPSAGSLEGLVREGAVRLGSHAVGIATIPVLFFGFLGVTERLRAAPVLAPAALVAYGFASVAGMCAGVLNGLAAPAFADRMVSDAALHETARVVLAFSFQLNAAFARVFMVGISGALLLWAFAVTGTQELPPWLGRLAGVLGGVGLVAAVSGHLGTGVHEFGLFVLGFASWTIAVGVALLRAAPEQVE